ncbi:MAG: hypothetical protein ABW199_11460 [Caulobacterales bacterium]
MELKPGSRWKSAVCDTEIVIVRPAKGDVSLECGGYPMVAQTAEKPAGLTMKSEFSGGTLMGKRYADPDTGVEALCSKGGAGTLGIDGRAIQLQEAKKLPASD